MTPVSPSDFLQRAVEGYAPYLQPSGELHDPVFNVPTQYGTPYYALCNAVLAVHVAREPYLSRAVTGLEAALRHVENPAEAAHASWFGREEGSVGGRNHRDFFWPAILKIYEILQRLGHESAAAFAARIAAVDIEAAVSTTPPSNWAAVWLSGEWLRMRAGLSPYSLERFDDALTPFFEGAILLEQGFYQEPGHSNSYDLFTRYHLADMLQAGYSGRWQQDLETLMRTGAKRSLAVQLSDGSLASAHRSTGQTWTLGAQCAFLTHAGNFFQASHPELSAAARAGADRAFSSMGRWQRDGAPFSPVENCLPPEYRVGYEAYTADGHYAPLALAFLALAIEHGLSKDATSAPPREKGVRLERDPIYRAVLHEYPYSVHVNAFPTTHYDAFGLVDLTTGLGRYLHVASSAVHLASGKRYNLGLATRPAVGRSPLEVIAQQEMALKHFEVNEELPGLELEARPKGQPYIYRLKVDLSSSGVQVSEATPRHKSHKTLLIPYLRDAGTGVLTEVHTLQNGVRLEHGGEALEITLDEPLESALVLPHGFENRRGLCGLLRLDVAELREAIHYTVSILH